MHCPPPPSIGAEFRISNFDFRFSIFDFRFSNFRSSNRQSIAPSISATIASAAATGSGAPVIGRPTTR